MDSKNVSRVLASLTLRMTYWFSLGVVIEMTRNGKAAKQNGKEIEVRFVAIDAFCTPLPHREHVLEWHLFETPAV